MVQNVTPAHKGLAPSRLILIFIRKRCPCRAHTRYSCLLPAKAGNISRCGTLSARRMKNWKHIYEKKHQEAKGWGFRHVVDKRILRYKVNAPKTKEHLSELEYLITNYDYHKTLLRRYEHLISEESKNEWLDNYYEPKGIWNDINQKFHTALIPFYLINPRTENERIDKHFLNDQILMSLGCLDHKFKKYRWRANYMLEFLPLKFLDLKPNLRIRIIEVLSFKSTNESIKQINNLIFKYQNEIHKELIVNFVEEQQRKNLISDKMAIGYLKRFKNEISTEMANKFVDKIRSLENGKYILSKISS
jgi:hypothetical protein